MKYTTSKESRRRFLAGTALTLGGAALARRARGGQDGAEPIRVAVVGTGARGCDLIRALTTIEAAEIVAVCDDYPPHLKRGAQYAGASARTYSSLTRMLADARPQALVIAMPPARHAAMCLEALDAGCDVFCEKIMCYSIEQAREVAAAVEKREAVFQVGLQRRTNAIYRQAAAMAETGMLGRISAIQCGWHRHDNWRRPLPVAKENPAWPELERRLNWRLYRESSQGLMAELASHQLDVANWILGVPPVSVIASGGIDYWRDGREVYDNVFCTYEYRLPVPRPKGAAAAPGEAPPADAQQESYTVRVTFSSIQNNAYQGAAELIMGDRGTLFLTQQKGLFYQEEAARKVTEREIADGAAMITAGKTLKMKNDPWAHRGKPYEIDTDSDDTRAELVEFLDCCATRNRATLCDARAGLLNAATVLIANQAMHENRRIEFPELLSAGG